MITKRKGTDVRDTRDLRNRLALIRSGEQVTLTYLRGSDTKAAKLEPVRDPPQELQARPAANTRQR